MSRNLSDSKQERDLLNRIALLEQQMREKGTLQLNAANGIRIIGYPETISVVFDVVAANSTSYFYFALAPVNQMLTIWNFYFSVYVDSPGLPTNAAFKLPNGVSLSAPQKNIRLSSWADWGDSNDSDGTRLHYIEIENQDSNNHNVMITGKFYGPEADVVV